MSSKYIDITAIIQVIGAVYNQPSLLDMEDKYHFNEEDFTEEFHQILFSSIYNLHALGAKEISINAIEDYLEQRPKKMAVYKANKGQEYLEKIKNNVQIATFDYYYNRMKKMTLLRMYQNAGMDLSWLYDIDNIFDAKKKQIQEDWLDNTPINEIADIIDKKISGIRLKYIDNADGRSVEAGDGTLELLERLKKTPEVGYPLYGSIINTITRGARLKKLYLRSAATGVGKAIPNYTLIPTPNGFKRVDEIQVGDYLIGQDGQPTQILAKYPQPEKKEIWKVTFSDGRIAECCKDHLWEYRYDAHRGYAYRVESLEELYNRTLKLKNGLKDSRNKGFRFHIKLNEEVQYITKDFSIDPYVMGAILGDGSLRYTKSNKALTFSSETDEIPNIIARLTNTIARKSSNLNYNWTFHTNEYHNLWVEELFANYPDLWNLKSEDKYIPKDYLLGDVQQRYSLLQGLMDTDGSIDEKGRTTFTTVSSKLRDDIIELVRSLGMIGTYLIDSRTEKYTTGECYKVIIQCKKENKLKMFRLQRKLEKAKLYASNGRRNEYKDHLAIINIEKTEQKVDMTCFTVDNDSHLFLMNDYIVTHNTRSMIADICNFGCDMFFDKNKNEWVQNGSKEPALFISTEQEISEIQTMMIAFIANVNEEHILNGEYLDDEWERVTRAAQILKSSPIYIKELPDFSLQDVENVIKYEIREHDVRYVAFDYLHSSMKILSEISSKSGVKGLREDNILFMMAIRLKDICNEYGVFIITATQLNGGYQSAQIYDQNLLRGAKSIADRIDVGMIMLNVSQEDREALSNVIQQGGFPMPDVKISIYKNRRGRWKDVLLWCQSDKGTCRIEPMFVTNYQYELQEIEDLKIKIKPSMQASAF